MLELAQLTDREAVNTLALQVHEMHINWRPDIYEHTDCRYPEERFQSAVKKRELYVAKISGVVVGYALLPMRVIEQTGLVRRKVMKVDEFCVAESCRNQGIGKEMMADIRALAKAFGCTDLQLCVYPQNEDAVAFYQKCGFSIRSIDMQMKV